MFSDPVAGQQSLDAARRALPPAGPSPRADATAHMLDALSAFSSSSRRDARDVGIRRERRLAAADDRDDET